MKICLRKNVCLSVIIAILLSCFPVNTALAADTFLPPAEGQKELLLNNSFENTDDGALQYWALSGGTWNGEPGASVMPDAGYGGSGNAVKLATSDSVRDVYLTHKTRTIPGARYQISFFVKVQSMAKDAGIKFTLSYDKQEGGNFGSYNPTYSIKEGAADTWIQYVHHFTAEGAQNGITHMRLRLLGGASIVYVDSVSLYAIEVPEGEVFSPSPPVQIVPDDPFLPPAAGEAELLYNTGFENLKSTGGMKNWTASGGVWGREPGVSIIEKSEDPAHVLNGDRAIRIANNLYETRANVTQWVHLVPRAQYQASVWVHVAEGGSADVRFSMAYWDMAHKKNPGGYQTGAFRYKNRVREWVQYVAHFEALEKGDNEVEFRVDLFGGDGIVYFDDVSLYMIKPPAKMRFSTDELYYYTENSTGIMTVEASAETKEEFPGTTVDFFVKNGVTILEERTNVSTENTARFIFDLTRLEIGKTYTAEAVLRDGNGTALETQHISVKRHLPRPHALTEEGFYKEQIQDANGVLKDKTDAKGNPVLLDIMIAYTKPNDISLLSEQGVTAYICSVSSDISKDSMQAELDAAAKNNLKVLVGLYPNMKPAGHPENIEMSTYYINKYKNHPAVLGWAVLDEPSAYFKEKELPKLMEDSYLLIRSLDPVHPVYAVEATTEFLPLIANYVDILASDPYPYHTNPIAGRTATYLRAAAEAADFKKPTASIVQLRELNGYFPTVTEVRNMYYQALFEGTGMLGFYAFKNAYGGKDLNLTDRWEGHVQFGNQEQKDALDAFVYRKYPVFNASTEIAENIWYAGFVREGAVYMYIINHDEVNRSAVPKVAQIPLFSDGGRIRINGFKATLVYGEGEAVIEGEGSVMQVSLPENGAVVYKITPLTPTDFSSLPKSSFRDLGRHKWAAEEIRILANEGIVEGITKTAFRPAFHETVSNFSEAVAKILKIPETNLLSETGLTPDADLVREDMIRLVFKGLKRAGIKKEAVLDIATLVKGHILTKNIADNIFVSRAESAVVLSRLKEWKENTAALEAEVEKLHTEDAERLAVQMVSGNATVSGGIWQCMTETELILYNVAGAREKEFAVVGEAVQKLYGAGEISVSDGTLHVNFAKSGPMIVRIFTKAPFGLYKEDELLSCLEAGELRVKHAEGTGMIAVYVMTGGQKELLMLEKDGVTFSPQAGTQYVMTAMDWTEGLRPMGKAYTVGSE